MREQRQDLSTSIEAQVGPTLHGGVYQVTTFMRDWKPCEPGKANMIDVVEYDARGAVVHQTLGHLNVETRRSARAWHGRLWRPGALIVAGALAGALLAWLLLG